MQQSTRPEKQAIENEQYQILQQLEHWLEAPMLLLSLAWLALFIVELIWGLSPLLDGFSIAIWLFFILEFIVKLILAPRKIAYLKTNWLTVISLLLPALRTLRIVRFLRVLRTSESRARIAIAARINPNQSQYVIAYSQLYSVWIWLCGNVDGADYTRWGGWDVCF